jgi:2-polyprenyl-3-methyl-5-hydroxy-6-metoxy-1,4-benzoquinol methylase
MATREDLRTDSDWEHFARADPYWAVLTADQFRRENLDAATRTAFFESGEWQIRGVFDALRGHIDPAFAPKRALDFGCGVGRMLVPLAHRCAEVVGVDISETMLHEAANNCRAARLEHVTLVKGDDDLSAVAGAFDLVHTFIVLQHIPVERGMRIARRLVELIAPGGCGALHVTYATAPGHLAEHGPLGRLVRAVVHPVRRLLKAAPPEMQMNAYPLNELFQAIQAAGAGHLLATFTDHGGRHGVQLLFRKKV